MIICAACRGRFATAAEFTAHRRKKIADGGCDRWRAMIERARERARAARPPMDEWVKALLRLGRLRERFTEIYCESAEMTAARMARERRRECPPREEGIKETTMRTIDETTTESGTATATAPAREKRARKAKPEKAAKAPRAKRVAKPKGDDRKAPAGREEFGGLSLAGLCRLMGAEGLTAADAREALAKIAPKDEVNDKNLAWYLWAGRHKKGSKLTPPKEIVAKVAKFKGAGAKEK